MALIKCHECGNEVSTTAKACPKCGAEVKEPIKLSKPVWSTRTKLIRWGLIVAVLLFPLGAIFYSASNYQSPYPEGYKTPQEREAEVAADKRKEAFEREVKERWAVKEGERAVRSFMKDPESAIFKGTRVAENGMLCGMVNAKNEFGGYTGFQTFIYVPSLNEFYMAGTEGYFKLWDKVCK